MFGFAATDDLFCKENREGEVSEGGKKRDGGGKVETEIERGGGRNNNTVLALRFASTTERSRGLDGVRTKYLG